MPLASGSRFGAYEVLSPLGSGGMGEVYRARDTKLHREVALKLLSQKLAPVPDRLARFEREAHLLASLNHPNIATIHGLEDADGEKFLVLELVEGETLAERIARGPIPLEKALPLFDQVAHGLEAAHEKGIIHRDLKPANIKITPDGHVKILDFGLGKVFEAPEAGQVDLSQSPTLTREGTRTGVILGTAAYMSPEQARGDAVDKRTDIWAFGCCLYEALTGKPAFAGDTVTDIIASVVKTEPDWKRLPAGTPSLVQRVLKRCLTKEAAQRLHDIADARLDLEDPALPAPRSTGTEPATRPGWILPGAVLLGLVALASMVLLWRRAGVPGNLPVTRVEIDTGPLDLWTPAIAFSPDGTKLAYLPEADDAIYVRHMDSGIATPLAETQDVDARMPVFSPDGKWVLFQDRRHLKMSKVPVDGGAAVALGDITPGFQRGHDWAPDDTIVFADREELHEVPARGGSPRLLKAQDGGGFRTQWPQVLPGGKAILLTSSFRYGDENAVLQEIETGKRRVLVKDANEARYVPTGHIVFLRNDVLYGVRYDSERLEVEGEPVPVVEGIHVSMVNFSAQYAFSDTGTLAYVPADGQGFRRRLVWVDREGKVEPIQTISRRIVSPRISPDGELVALTAFDGIQPSLWLAEVARDTFTPFEKERSMSPSWSPDGRSIAFAAPESISTQSLAKGDAVATPIVATLSPWDPVWSPDGNTILFSAMDKQSIDIWRVSLEKESEPVPFLRTSAFEGTPGFSPDGRWIVYASDESGRDQIYLQPFANGGQKRQISTEGGSAPVWSPDGGEIFYRLDRAMMSVQVQAEPVFRASTPRVLFEGDFLYHDHPWKRNYDISPDGKRFLMIQSEAEPVFTKVKIVLNWFEELKRLVPAE